jgi:hypothetical protein
MAAYLAERYWPGLDEPTALHAVRRLVEQADSAGAAATTRILTCAFVAEEQTVLVLVIAPRRDDVAEMGLLAGVSFDRIVNAVVLPIGPSPARDAALDAEGGHADPIATAAAIES